MLCCRHTCQEHIPAWKSDNVTMKNYNIRAPAKDTIVNDNIIEEKA